MNSVNLIGRITRDLELRYIQGSGTAVTNFTLAIDKGLSKDKKQEMESQNKPTADFINVVVWGKSAENCVNYLAKGRLVAVEGRLQSGSYDDKDGKKVYTTDVTASKVHFIDWGDKQQEDGSIEGFHPTDNDSIPF